LKRHILFEDSNEAEPNANELLNEANETQKWLILGIAASRLIVILYVSSKYEFSAKRWV
jgi:hypothetical protein